MKNRTDFVRVGWKEQLWQAVCNQMEAAKAVLWVLFGFVVGLGNMMMEISPFGAALCAAVPQSHLLPTAFGAAAGSLLLSNLSQLGGTHTFTIKYAAAVVIITAVRRVFQPSKEEGGRLSLLMPYKPAAAPLLAFAGILLPSLAVLLASPFDLYSVVMSFSEAILAGACAYFLTRSLHAFSLGQGMFTLKRADFISVVLTSSMMIVSLSNITFGGISFGRLLASIAVAVVCAGRRGALGSGSGHRMRNGGERCTVPQNAAAGSLCVGRTCSRSIFRTGEMDLCRRLRRNLWSTQCHYGISASHAAFI